ncbi:N-acetylmuramoyl-L-alanine amidase [Marinibaculum pumilum]|uniref:N-acetylmuramoyl-L-alanine amidase n=1 Tax=Marinibaculum pumilum TaxID=1766165 RepID=A0ABV7KXX0_9PROT
MLPSGFEGSGPVFATALPVVDRPSPNHGPRVGGDAVEMVLLHYTDMESMAAAADRLTDPAAEVSAHYLVDEDGTIHRLVPEGRRAWHAGRACWAGLRDVNSRSIGIEIVNPGHSCGYRPFPAAQMDAVTALCTDIVARHRIDPRLVLAHSDVAPQRKRDPGELFDWARLARAGLGLWPRHGFDPEAAAAHAPAMAPGQAGAVVLDLQFALDGIGYEVEGNGLYDPYLAAVVTAFQRHFRPALCDGAADPETLGLVYEILAVAQGPRPSLPARADRET